MGRRPRQDRKSVAFIQIGLRLNVYEHEMLRNLIDAYNQRLYEQGLPPMMNATSLIKQLLLQEGDRLGFHDLAEKMRIMRSLREE